MLVCCGCGCVHVVSVYVVWRCMPFGYIFEHDCDVVVCIGVCGVCGLCD